MTTKHLDPAPTLYLGSSLTEEPSFRRAMSQASGFQWHDDALSEGTRRKEEKAEDFEDSVMVFEIKLDE